MHTSQVAILIFFSFVLLVIMAYRRGYEDGQASVWLDVMEGLGLDALEEEGDTEGNTQ